MSLLFSVSCLMSSLCCMALGHFAFPVAVFAKYYIVFPVQPICTKYQQYSSGTMVYVDVHIQNVHEHVYTPLHVMPRVYCTGGVDVVKVSEYSILPLSFSLTLSPPFFLHLLSFSFSSPPPLSLSLSLSPSLFSL